MSDRRLRELERRWLQSGALPDEVVLLSERARADQHGGVPRLEVAALLGYGPARAALSRCVRQPTHQRQAERALGITHDDLLAWEEAGCPIAGERRYDLIEVLRWADERDVWPEGAGPVRALVRALHRAEPEAGARAALGVASAARGDKQSGSLARLTEFLEDPTPAHAQALQGSLQRLERRLSPADDRRRWRARTATQAILCAGRAAPTFDLNWMLGAVAAAAQSKVAAQRRWRHVTRHLVEADLLRTIRQEVLPWALGYAPRPDPRDRWRVEHSTDSGSARLRGSFPRMITQHTFRVVDAESGRAALTLSGETETFPNDDYLGVNRVTISADGTEAIVFQLGGDVERHPLAPGST